MKYSFYISKFLEEISSLSPSIVFLYSFALFIEEGILSFLAILWNSAFNWIYLSLSPLLFTSLLLSAIWKASSDNHFAFLHFFFLGMVLISTSCTMLWTSVHSSSGALSTRSNPFNLFVTSTVFAVSPPGCLLWPVHSLDKTLLAFDLLRFVLQGQIWLILQISLDFLLLHSNPLWWKEHCFCC